MLLDERLVWKDMDFEGSVQESILLIFLMYTNTVFVYIANISLEMQKIPKCRGKSVSSDGPHAIPAAWCILKHLEVQYLCRS